MNTSSEAKTFLEHHEAAELIRKQQQGLGRPILAVKAGEQQMVAVGSTLYHSSAWKTFPDFLGDYLKLILGGQWGNAEIKKPFEKRHPILQWYDKYCKLQQEYLDGTGKVMVMPTRGVVYCYMGLAYSLYLLKHNVQLQQRYIERLKDVNNFQGAYYELVIANCLIRLGLNFNWKTKQMRQPNIVNFRLFQKKRETNIGSKQNPGLLPVLWVKPLQMELRIKTRRACCRNTLMMP